MSEEKKTHKEGGMPFWLILLWFFFLLWIVGYIIVGLLKGKLV